MYSKVSLGNHLVEFSKFGRKSLIYLVRRIWNDSAAVSKEPLRVKIVCELVVRGRPQMTSSIKGRRSRCMVGKVDTRVEGMAGGSYK